MYQIVPIIKVNNDLVSIFSEESFDLFDSNGMFISKRQAALNFRYRKSQAGYQSDWHVAGDPTLIIVQQGKLRISLRNGDSREFMMGDMFIAADYLPFGQVFNETSGHRAQVVGTDTLVAVHLKLSTAV